MHKLLGKSVPVQAFTGLHVWEAEIDLHNFPYLKDHAFQDSENAVLPGAFYVETALAMVLHTCSNATPHLKEVQFNNLLTLTANDVLKLRTRLEMSADRTKYCGYQMTILEENGSEVLVSEGLAVFESALTSYEGNVENLLIQIVLYRIVAHSIVQRRLYSVAEHCSQALLQFV